MKTRITTLLCGTLLSTILPRPFARADGDPLPLQRHRSGSTEMGSGPATGPSAGLVRELAGHSQSDQVHALAAGLEETPRHQLAVHVVPQFRKERLRFDTLALRTPAGQVISVTRLDFLLSHIALHQIGNGGGRWLGLTNWFEFVSPREGRAGFELNNLPAGHYDRLRFHVGLAPEANHSDPAQYPPRHALNPILNGLHWNWQGGYVFLALEGRWRQDNGQESGYAYHLATDRLLAAVELPFALELSADHEIDLALHVDQILAGEPSVQLSEDTATTHSRADDALATRLRDNLQRAFAVEQIRPAPASRPSTPVSDRVEVAPDATPYALEISRSFPRPALPLDNPLTEEGVRLGALLFADPRLSANDVQSCASCHQPANAFTDGKAVSRGAEGRTGTRSAMPLFNLAWKSSFFWDGRAPTLREQVLQPIQNPIEMHETLGQVVARLRSARVSERHQERATQLLSRRLPAEGRRTATPAAGALRPEPYAALFQRAFGTPEISADRIARALEQFLLVQVSHDSKFDRSRRGEATLTAEEKRGLELFNTEYDPRRRQFGADCFHCHGGPLFQSQTFANNGLDAVAEDAGRFLVTGREGDRGKFAVPSLRNVALTAPYMHDGRFATLEQVIEHYSAGVKRSPTLDPNLAKHPRGGVPLRPEDKQALVAFLKTLTDERFLAGANSAGHDSVDPADRTR